MKPGPKPKHPEVRRLEGNPGCRTIKESAIRATGEAFAPNHLHEDARACLEVIRGSMPPDLYAAADAFALSAFAEAWAWHKRAVTEMNRPMFEPMVGGSMGQLRPNPWFRVMATMSAEMRAWGDRLGLDPVCRAALVAPADRPKGKFDGLLNLDPPGPRQ